MPIYFLRMERVFLVVGRAVMVLGLLVGVYALWVGVMGGGVGMGAMAKQMKAFLVALGLFGSGFFFARAGAIGQEEPPPPGSGKGGKK